MSSQHFETYVSWSELGYIAHIGRWSSIHQWSFIQYPLISIDIHWYPLIPSLGRIVRIFLFFSLSLSLSLSLSPLVFDSLNKVKLPSAYLSSFAIRVAFYLPYAWFTLTFNYSYGQEPGFVAGMTFSMVVVAGNALMYLVCSEAILSIHRWGHLWGAGWWSMEMFNGGFIVVFSVTLKR